MRSVTRSMGGIRPRRVPAVTRTISSVPKRSAQLSPQVSTQPSHELSPQLTPQLATQLSPQAPPSDPHGTTGKICNWVKSIELKDVPEEIRTHTKYLILDGIGCALVGAKLPWSRTATEAILKMEGPGNCTVFGWDKVRISLISSDARPSVIDC
ncbi:MAG: hypothetical protein FRX48_02665 [Lasallia pustulata]|uniref:MmgE/PrpD N-terminal domain-containing protein n=1 Tax=Lasallia pustulata TaxID=136370 RepID=A0A5M8PZH9_9LECA|nr:MAG: hypothetical protein FRX48_02665 [Lasallia pustulata]